MSSFVELITCIYWEMALPAGFEEYYGKAYHNTTVMFLVAQYV